jgi:hypothetical protein
MTCWSGVILRSRLDLLHNVVVMEIKTQITPIAVYP